MYFVVKDHNLCYNSTVIGFLYQKNILNINNSFIQIKKTILGYYFFVNLKKFDNNFL